MSTVRCGNCGAEAPAGAQFCSACGAALVAMPAPEAGQPYPPPPPAWAAPPPPQQGSGTAVAALVLGIGALVLFWFPFLGLPAGIIGIILGVIARRSPNRGMAIGGIVCSTIGLVLGGIYLIFIMSMVGEMLKHPHYFR